MINFVTKNDVIVIMKALLNNICPSCTTSHGKKEIMIPLTNNNKFSTCFRIDYFKIAFSENEKQLDTKIAWWIFTQCSENWVKIHPVIIGKVVTILSQSKTLLHTNTALPPSITSCRSTNNTLEKAISLTRMQRPSYSNPQKSTKKT